MRADRRLALRRETLTELSPQELSFNAGADTSYDDVTDKLRTIALKLTLNAQCSWSCTGPTH